jgi:hypothetical protein
MKDPISPEELFLKKYGSYFPRALNILGFWLSMHVKMLRFFNKHVQTILNFSPYAALSSIYDKKRQIEPGVDNVLYTSLIRPSLSVFFCPSLFLPLSFLLIFTV